MLLGACSEVGRLRVLAGSVVMLAVMAVALMLTPDIAHAYEVRISISGAGQVNETTPANLVGSSCFSSSTTPTGTVGKTCLAGTPDGAYGWGWEVDYVASAAPGYSFVRWESDGTSRSPVICDRSNPPATDATYNGATCKFRTYDNLQTRAVFADNTIPPTPTISGMDPNSGYTNGSMKFFFNLSQPDPTFKQFQCRVTPTVQTSFANCSSGVSFSPSSQGTYTFEVRATDHSGNNSFPTSRTFTVDTTGPGGTVSIAGGAQATNTTSVGLTLSASDPSPNSGVASMRFSNDGVVWSAWEPYATGKSWTLTDGEGTKTVHVQYRDRAGNVSEGVEDTIRLDTTSPTLERWTPTGKKVSPKAKPTVVFSESMNVASVEEAGTFSLTRGTKTVAGSVRYVETSTGAYKAVLTPSKPLKSGATYKATLSTTAKDEANNALASPKTWKFTVK